MRTLDDEANALLSVREHVAKAAAAIPRGSHILNWDRMSEALFDMQHDIDRALKEIGAN